MAERELTYRGAINEALRQEMRRDESVFVMGEDIAGAPGRDDPEMVDAWGGVLKVTEGLINEFGPERVRDTPITESAFIGAGVGAAATGMRPVVELMFIGFMGVTLDQIINQAAKMRYMFGGKAKIPLVIRTTIGAGFRAAAQHSDATYSTFVHFPGLKVVAPATPYDAKGLLISAIRDDDPVIFCENKVLYDTTGPVPEEDYTVPLGPAGHPRDGADVTIVAIIPGRPGTDDHCPPHPGPLQPTAGGLLRAQGRRNRRGGPGHHVSPPRLQRRRWVCTVPSNWSRSHAADRHHPQPLIGQGHPPTGCGC